jgi:hypothetical protein
MTLVAGKAGGKQTLLQRLNRRNMQTTDIARWPLQPCSLALFRCEEFTVNRIVDYARDQLPVLIRSKSGGAVFETQRDIEEGKAVGEIRGAIERIHIPSVCALQAGACSFLAINAVAGKLLVKPADDEFFRCSIGFGHQVYIAFIFGGHAAIEVAAKKLAGFQGNRSGSGGKTQIQLLRKVAQRGLLSTRPLLLRVFPSSRRPHSLIVRIWCL